MLAWQSQFTKLVKQKGKLSKPLEPLLVQDLNVRWNLNVLAYAKAALEFLVFSSHIPNSTKNGELYVLL